MQPAKRRPAALVTQNGVWPSVLRLATRLRSFAYKMFSDLFGPLTAKYLPSTLARRLPVV